MANSVTISTLKVWFKYTLAWLNVDRGTERLQRPHQQMLELMEKAYAENRPNDVWEIIEELEQLTIQMTSIQEQGEIFLKCAKMACELENLRETARLCSLAENKFKSYQHQHAVSLWINGCIQWAMHQRVKAISNWRESIHLFETRKASLQLDSKRVFWYNQMIPKLEQYLENAINDDVLPEYKDDAFSPAQPASSNGSSLDVLQWMSIPVSDSVPAGGFGAVGHETEMSFLHVSETLIEHERYSVHSTHRNSLWQNSVVISPAEKYHTVRVTGNSMNNAKPVPIENGDYILVRLQNKAGDNDIVVAHLNENEPRATVKRLSLSGGRITLRPESLDPNIQNDPDFERDYSPHEVRISGVVEAVFKKKTGS